MNNRIEMTKKFLEEEFAKSEYLKNKEYDRTYRLEHSYRVANIGKLIAEQEQMNVEQVMIGCLLHDIAYVETFKNHEDIINHGRLSAQIARPFLLSLGYNEKEVNEICYGIAIHVDDKADFEGEKNAFTLTIGDADNIDRFDVYRIYDTLVMRKYDEMNLEEKEAYATMFIEKLEKYRDMKLGTKTASKMWINKVDYQLEFYRRLLSQIKNSVIK